MTFVSNTYAHPYPHPSNSSKWQRAYKAEKDPEDDNKYKSFRTKRLLLSKPSIYPSMIFNNPSRWDYDLLSEGLTPMMIEVVFSQAQSFIGERYDPMAFDIRKAPWNTKVLALKMTNQFMDTYFNKKVGGKTFTAVYAVYKPFYVKPEEPIWNPVMDPVLQEATTYEKENTNTPFPDYALFRFDFLQLGCRDVPPLLGR